MDSPIKSSHSNIYFMPAGGGVVVWKEEGGGLIPTVPARRSPHCLISEYPVLCAARGLLILLREEDWGEKPEGKTEPGVDYRVTGRICLGPNGTS